MNRSIHSIPSRFAIKTLFIAVLAANASSVFAATQAEIDAAFTEGINLRDTGNLDASIQKFQDLLSSEPSLGRVRAELAVSYFQALNFSAAREQAQQLLDNPDTPPTVKANVQKLLDEINNQSKPHVFTPYVNFGIGHDTNINVGPSTNIINIGGAQLVGGAVAQSSNYAMLNVGLAHRYLAPNTVNIFGRNAAMLWNSNVSYYRNDYFKNDTYDLDVLSLSTGPMVAAANHWRIGIDFTYDYINLGNNKLADFYGIAPTATYFLNSTTELAINGALQKRDFSEKSVTNRDSDYQMIGASLTHQMLGGKLSGQVGANIFNEDVKDDTFSNSGYQLTAGLSYRATEADTIYGRHSFKNMDYDAPVVLFNVARDEDENRTTVGYRHRFSQKYINDWVVDASVTHTNNDSNVSIFEYRRTQYSINFGKQF